MGEGNYDSERKVNPPSRKLFTPSLCGRSANVRNCINRDVT